MQTESLFDLQILETFWLSDTRTEYDLCAHGKVRVTLGSHSFVNESATISATALVLLRSLERNHSEQFPLGEHLLPCCGHFLIYTKEMKEVLISGCFSGDNWAIIHQQNTVLLKMENGSNTIVSFSAYKQTVLRFVDQVEQFYENSPKKVLPEEDFDRVGYLRFWKEWRLHRAKWSLDL
jgi:hypothetical protein